MQIDIVKVEIVRGRTGDQTLLKLVTLCSGCLTIDDGRDKLAQFWIKR